MPSLSTPLELGPLTLRNRNVMASLTRNRAVPTSVPNDAMVTYYTQRAKGGCGLILTEGTLISQQGTEWPNAPGIWSEEHVKAWKKVTDSVHGAGGLIFSQIWHVGRVAHPDAPEQKASGRAVPGPSAISARGGKFRSIVGSNGYVTPTPIADPWEIINEYKIAAQNAKEAGFDGVELHSANGYLIAQFLDSTANTRTDMWGGSIVNRCRFGLECLKVLMEVWGNDLVGIKLNPCGGYNDVGMPLEENIATYSYYITEINKMKPAYVQLVRYVPIMDPIFDGKHRATKHDVLETYRPLLTNTKTFLNGILTPQEATDLISAGKIDAAVFGTLWIGNPDLQLRIEQGVPLNETPDPHLFYVFHTGVEQGYADYEFKAEVV